MANYCNFEIRVKGARGNTMLVYFQSQQQDMVQVQQRLQKHCCTIEENEGE